MKVRETKEASKCNKSIKDIILKLNKSFVDMMPITHSFEDQILEKCQRSSQNNEFETNDDG